MDSPRWLNEDEQRFWRKLLQSRQFAVRAMDEALQHASGISSPDFAILVNLSEDEDHCMRLNELGNLLGWDRSRVSHQVKRMERRGLLEKRACSSDKRGIEVALTELGWQKIQAAAPGHVETVRSIFFDQLEPGQLEALEKYLDSILEIRDTSKGEQ
ncbi:MAG: MarR family winged helix-turn-helix transcriptional regulator [Corynebacterium sp.]|nr:MarR family winged helix-turn-helix transcriptional regulator [Corynebacterium sp.]